MPSDRKKPQCWSDLRETPCKVETHKPDDDIGIPNVTAIVYYEERKVAQDRLRRGLCPEHIIPLREDGECERCERRREP